MRGVVEMSTKELERLNVLHNVRDKTITQAKAAELLGISDRQIRNLLARFDKNGAQGLISMKRGCPSNHRKSSEFKERVLSIIKEKYDDSFRTNRRHPEEKQPEKENLLTAGKNR